MSGFAIGVDGGGTRTRAVVLDGEGRELARAEGGSASAVHPGAAAEAVAEVSGRAVSSAGGRLPADTLWAGLTGAGREDARAAAEAAILVTGVARRVCVGTDIAAAFHDAFGNGPGILLVAGTGSIAWGRAEDDREARVGGWGHHLGDEGSAYAIGAAALKEATWQADGRAPRTSLPGALLAHLGLSGPSDLIGWVASATKREVAALAPLVTRAASGGPDVGDPAAGAILARAAADLEAHIATLLGTLAPWGHPPAVALTGGLLQPGGPLRAPLEEALARRGLQPALREPDPAMGAARLALGLVQRPTPLSL